MHIEIERIQNLNRFLPRLQIVVFSVQEQCKGAVLSLQWTNFACASVSWRGFFMLLECARKFKFLY